MGLPAILSGTSRRVCRVPISFQSLGAFKSTCVGGAISAADAAIRPYVMLRPLGRWLITPCAAVHSATGTFHCAAAAAISIARAVAPARRNSFCEVLMERLAPVDI